MAEVVAMEKTLNLPRLKCKRCDYEWIPRRDEPPKTCASKKCKSPYWNKERIRKKTKEADKDD